MSFRDSTEAALRSLELLGLRRHPREISSIQAPRMVVDGRSVLCFCSNNYLGLAGSGALVEAVKEGLEREGVGAGASRLISGTMTAHRQSEAKLAAFVGRPSALLFSSGYACNVGTLQALAGREDIVFSDALNHASLIDGARLSRARIVVYAHADAADLERKLRAHRAEGRTALVVSESLFSMDGDAAPLDSLASLARDFEAGLIIDEAHALGIFGPEGRGLCAASGVRPDLLIGTLGKAFGLQGAFVAGEEAAIDLIQNRARSYVYSTAPSPSLAFAATRAVDLISRADPLRGQLRRHWIRLREGLSRLGFHVLPGDSPIIPVMVGDPAPTMALSQALYERGVFVHGIRPPTVPTGTGRLRLVPMAVHGDEDISEALAAFAEVRP